MGQSMPPYVPRDPLLWRIMPKLPESAGCLVLVLWAIAVTPFIPFFLWRQARRRAYFRKALAAKGRILSWPQFLGRTNGSCGSIIIEVGSKAQTRFWWADDRILAQAPLEPPKFSELIIVSYGGTKYHPFARWCYEHYLSLDAGRALLACPVEADFETFPFAQNFDELMRARFPNQEVVVLTFYDARYV
jgi:hypothetical protein